MYLPSDLTSTARAPSIKLIARATVSDTLESPSTARNTPALFPRRQPPGSAALSDGLGSLSVRPMTLIRTTLPDKLYDSGLRRQPCAFA